MDRRSLVRTAALAIAAFMLLGAPVSAMAAPASSPTLTSDLRAKLVQLTSASGMDREIPAPLAAKLGFPVTGAAWPDRQLTVRQEKTAELHAVAVGRSGADQDMVFSVRGPAAISVFRVGPDGTLKSAANYFLQTGQVMDLPLAEARSEFSAELAFWASKIDAISAQN